MSHELGNHRAFTRDQVFELRKRWQIPFWFRPCRDPVNDHVIPRARRHVIPQVLALSMST